MSDNKALADRLNDEAEMWESFRSPIATPRTAPLLREAAAALTSPQADKARGEVPGFIRESLAALPPDDFRNDNFHLVACIEALLSLDKAGALVPHGVGGHARRLLASAAHRLAATTTPQPQGDASGQVSDGGELPEPAMVFSALSHSCAFSDGFELLDDTANFYSEAQMLAALSTPQARPDGGKPYGWIADPGCTIVYTEEAAKSYGGAAFPIYTHPAPAPDVARLVGLMREVVPALRASGVNMSLADDVERATAPFTAVQQKEVTNGQ